MDFSNKFGSKKLIKSPFEYDLDRILAGGRLNRMSLISWQSNRSYFLNQSIKMTATSEMCRLLLVFLVSGSKPFLASSPAKKKIESLVPSIGGRGPMAKLRLSDWPFSGMADVEIL